MCGRYTITLSPEEIEARYGVNFDRKLYKTNYNAAPTQDLPVITNEEPDKINIFRWGLIPFWTKELKQNPILINSRTETIIEKPSFRNIFLKRRCLIIADGFYEWKRSGSIKQPYRIILKNDQPFSFAGIWDKWKNNEGKVIDSFSIITTEANSLVKTIHDRMPVILSKNDEQKWLDGKTGNEELFNLLKPFNPDEMKMYPVNRSVNLTSNNSAELIMEVKNII